MLFGVLSAAVTLGVPAAPAGARPPAASKAWVDLGPGQAYGINDHGQVVGTVGGGGVFRAVMWQNGTQVDLGRLQHGLTECVATAINNAGQIAGQCSNAKLTVSHAFLWFHSRIHDLGTLPGSSDSGATAISSTGSIAGVSTPRGDAHLHGVLWKNGVIGDLGVLGSGYAQSIARGVNSHDRVVGWSTQSSGFEQAFEWANGTMSALKAPAGTQSEASGIDNNGQIAGALLGSGGLKPALWAGGAAVALPTLGKDGAALAINQVGQPAGWVETSTGGSHAAMWSNRRLVEVKRLGSSPGVKPPGRERVDAPPGLR